MKYFDLHCHPSLKTFLGAVEEKDRENCWEEVDVKGIWEIVDKLTGDILDSQSSLSQLKSGNFGLVVDALYSLEHPMIVGMIKELTNIRILSKKIPQLSHDLLQNMVDQEPGFGYTDVFKALQTHLLNSQNLHAGFNLINSIDELNLEKLNIILAIEGAHILYNDVKHFTKKEIFDNLGDIKNSPHKYLYITLAHLANNPFCNQCYGMKLMEDRHFLPKGDGITELGVEVIKKTLDNNTGNRILIDIKHMSHKSRIQYYKGMEDGTYPKVPIIISHAGVAGVSYFQRPIYDTEEINDDYVKVHYAKPKGLQGTEFNPWSINLYDEEIPTIIKSKGLIGMIMEERILGMGEVAPEYYSKDEFDDNQDFVDKNLKYFKDYHKRRKLEELNEEDEMYLMSKPLRYLCNNILHIVKVGGKAAWKHICFGTDYDGMINALNISKTANKFKRINKKLEEALLSMAESDPGTNYFTEKMGQKVEDILYNNAFNFLNENFK